MPIEQPKTATKKPVRYDWKRYWCPRSGRLNLMDGGFLVEPSSDWRRQLTDVVQYAEIATYHFLGCLGEPGIGKTDELNFIATQAAHAINSDVLRVDLERCRQTDFVQIHVIQTSTFQSWIAGTNRLYIFFENLDRLTLPARLLAEDLQDGLSSFPLDRLFIRIACRTFDWSDILELRMQTLFAQGGMPNAVGVFELAPLTRTDVELAATVEGVDAKKFIADVQAADVAAFATRPVTLRVLLNQYKRGGKLPATTVELYRQGCALLCSEPNPELQEQQAQKFAANQLMATATRIAAIMMFSQKSAIWAGVDDGNIPLVDIKLDDLVGNKESFDGIEVDVTRELVVETLSCGLFKSGGPGRFAFAHQTYAEYLAACYLEERKSSRVQILTLLVHPSDPGGKIVPQLTGVAAWMASMNSEIFDFMVEHDPQALLLADLERVGGPDRQALVNELLKLIETKGLPLAMMGQRYSKLSHPQLADQLRTAIGNTKSDIVQHEVIRIAQACQKAELVPDWLNVALNKTAEIYVRKAAIDAIAISQEEQVLRQLLPLAMEDQAEDVQDELKGAALTAVYPLCMSTDQLFASLTKHKDDTLLGSYVVFLDYELCDRLPAEDFPIALNWVRNNTSSVRNNHHLRRIEGLCDTLMWQGWQRLESAGIQTAFAEAALDRFLEHDSIVGGIHYQKFAAELAANEGRRRNLLNELIKVAATKESVSEAAFCIASIPSENDFQWLLDMLVTAVDAANRTVIIELARRCHRMDKADHLDALWQAKSLDAEIEKAFSFALAAIDLESPEAERAKDNHQRLMQWQTHEPKLLSPPPAERVLICLQHCENGHSQNWDGLTNQLMLASDARENTVIEIDNPDITSYPGWIQADGDTQKRIIAAGLQFLLDSRIDPELVDCLNATQLTDFARSGFKALVLVKGEAAAAYSALSEDVWRRWFAAAILFRQANGEKDLQRSIIVDAYKHVPAEFTAAVVARLNYEDANMGFMPTASLLTLALGTNLADALKKIDLSGMKPSSLDALLRLLATHPDDAREWMWSQILNAGPDRSDKESIVMIGARFLELGEWTEFWALVQSDVEFGKRVFAELSNLDHPKTFLDRLSDDQLVELYSWLWKQFPDDGALKTAMFRQQVPDMLLWDFRGQIPHLLSMRNSAASCEALEQIINQFPTLIGLRRMLDDARTRLRVQTWSPYEPKYVLRLANNRKARLVRSEADLMNVILEALQELQEDLQGHQPINGQLWMQVSSAWVAQIKSEKFDKSNQGKKVFRPREEADFSDFVANYLRKKLTGSHGVIINREVEIRSNPGGKGERTDIHVDAVAHSEDEAMFERVTVVIEAKGVWNQYVDTAMDTQLADQYLRNSGCKSGIYLVGYFNCPQWDPADPMMDRAKKYSLNDLRASLNTQATSLSRDGLKIQAVVLDASLRGLPPNKKK